MEVLKEDLKQKMTYRLLDKNKGRSMHFLQLNIDEICEVIDDAYEVVSDGD